MRLQGDFYVEGDKSICHRLALTSLIASGSISLENFSTCQDVASSLESVRQLGGKWKTEAGKLTLFGAERKVASGSHHINCGNSGTTTRFLMGLLSGIPGTFTLDGDDSLRKRPMERLAKVLREMGAEILCHHHCCPVVIKGKSLSGIDHTLQVASAQMKSALILAGLQADGMTAITEKVPSRDHTERLIKHLGGRLSKQGSQINVERSSLHLDGSFFVPGDVSSAAFFIGLAALLSGSHVTAKNVLINPTRLGFVDVLRRAGARLNISQKSDAIEPYGDIECCYQGPLHSFEVSPEEVPFLIDEIPILTLVATQAKGVSRFRGIEELKYKETDRAVGIKEELNKMGAKISIEEDTLVVSGPTELKAPAVLDSYKDHRLAMVLRLASVMVGNDLKFPRIKHENMVAISYPKFFQTFEELLR